MSYEVYKFIHVISVILFVSMIVRVFSTKNFAKIDKVFLHSSGFLILVGGMGLLARLGVSHTGGWPLWVKAKLGLWLVLFPVFAILSKRMVAKDWKHWPMLLITIILAAVYFAVFKP